MLYRLAPAAEKLPVTSCRALSLSLARSLSFRVCVYVRHGNTSRHTVTPDSAARHQTPLDETGGVITGCFCCCCPWKSKLCDCTTHKYTSACTPIYWYVYNAYSSNAKNEVPPPPVNCLCARRGHIYPADWAVVRDISLDAQFEYEFWNKSIFREDNLTYFQKYIYL